MNIAYTLTTTECYIFVRFFESPSHMLIKSFIIIFILVLLAVALLGVRIFFTKNKKFPNMHVGGNKHLQQKGIGCVQSQDREASVTNKNNIDVSNL